MMDKSASLTLNLPVTDLLAVIDAQHIPRWVSWYGRNSNIVAPSHSPRNWWCTISNGSIFSIKRTMINQNVSLSFTTQTAEGMLQQFCPVSTPNLDASRDWILFLCQLYNSGRRVRDVRKEWRTGANRYRHGWTLQRNFDWRGWKGELGLAGVHQHPYSHLYNFLRPSAPAGKTILLASKLEANP